MKGKHPDIVRFLTLYESIMHTTNGEAQRIRLRYKNDAAFAKTCGDIDSLAFLLELQVRESGDSVVPGADPVFIEAYRIYQVRLSPVVSDLVWEWLFSDLKSETTDTNESKANDNEGDDEAAAIELLIELGRAQDNDKFREDELIDALEEGVRAWKKLKGGIGLNLADVFRRYSLIEPVLVPIHIAISPSDSISLNRLLTDAHRAFIFGTYFAAIALCRSLTEHIIRDHYRIGPLDPEKRYPLEKRLQTAKQGDNEYLKNEVDDFLIQFVKEANDILHANTSRLFHRDRIEQTIVRWLEKIRRLIENLQSKS